jgi:hypothetical protein
MMEIQSDNRTGYALNLHEAHILAMLRMMNPGDLARMTGSLYMIRTDEGATFFYVAIGQDERMFLGNITAVEDGGGK